MNSRQFIKGFRIAEGSRFRLKDFDPAETFGMKFKEYEHEARAVVRHPRRPQMVHSPCHR